MANSDQSLYNLRFNQVTNELEGFGGGVYIPVSLTNVDPTQVPVTRLINTTSPLLGGGNLSVDRTLSIQLADATHSGYLSSADWNTFNGKQAAGSYITALTGDVTAAGPGSAAATLANTAVTPGAYTNANITVDHKGRITAAANGSSATPGGASGNVQFNLSGAFSGNAAFSYGGAGNLLLGDNTATAGSLQLLNDGGSGTNPAILSLNASGSGLPSQINFFDGSGTQQSQILPDVSGNVSIVTAFSGTPRSFVLGADGGLGMPNLTAVPGSPTEGQIVYNSTSHQLEYWNGSAWVVVTNGSSKLVNTVFSQVTAQQTASSSGFVAVGFSQTYTAVSTSNLLRLEADVLAVTTAAGQQILFEFTIDGVATGQVGQFLSQSTGTIAIMQHLTLFVSPTNLASHTYDLQFNSNNGGTTQVGDSTTVQTFTLQEVTNP